MFFVFVCSDVALVELLLAKGASPTVKSNSGATGNDNNLEFNLMSVCADALIFVSNTARDVALAQGHADVAALLERSQGDASSATKTTAHTAATAAAAVNAAAGDDDDNSSSSSTTTTSTTTTTSALPVYGNSAAGSAGSQYQTFDPTLRIVSQLKLRAVVGDEKCDKAMILM